MSTLDTVRKLLAKAEATDNPHERDAFNAKAADLIAKYGIDEALLAAERADRAPESVGDRIITVFGPYVTDKASLLNRIARACRVRVVLRSTSGTRKADRQAEVHLFGFAADLDRVEILFTSLLLQAATGLATAVPAWPGESVAAYRRSWLAGFASTIGARLEQAEKAAETTASTDGAPGVALVLRDRNAMVAAAVSDAYPRLTSGKSRTLTGSGYGAGAAAGRRANIGGTAVGGRAAHAAIG